jgi:hypothetical protein
MQSITETTITSANAIFMLKVPGLIDQNQKIHGYSADSAWSSAAASMTETIMGVDGYQSGGFTPFETPLTISLLANSPSQQVFNILVRDMIAKQETRVLEWSLSLPSIKKRFAGTGFMTEGQVIPNGAKTLQSTTYDIKAVITSIEDI